jgi:hypothetical protein
MPLRRTTATIAGIATVIAGITTIQVSTNL